MEKKQMISKRLAEQVSETRGQNHRLRPKMMMRRKWLQDQQVQRKHDHDCEGRGLSDRKYQVLEV